MTATDQPAESVRTLPRACVRHPCVICGKLFALGRSGQECCSARCRGRKSRVRHRAKVERLVAETEAALKRLAAEVVKDGHARN